MQRELLDVEINICRSLVSVAQTVKLTWLFASASKVEYGFEVSKLA
jgi:hypothetical protein